jgi:hypothetical protein
MNQAGASGARLVAAMSSANRPAPRRDGRPGGTGREMEAILAWMIGVERSVDGRPRCV